MFLLFVVAYIFVACPNLLLAFLLFAVVSMLYVEYLLACNDVDIVLIVIVLGVIVIVIVLVVVAVVLNSL